jgi:hypothetical protein
MTEALDPNKTYVLGVVENTAKARHIQSMLETSTPLQKRWSHCAALFLNQGVWTVIEARPIFGCHMLSLAAWIEAYADETVDGVYALPLLFNIAGVFSHVGKEFAYRYILGWKNGNREPKPENYVFCSEIIRRNDLGVLTVSPDDVTPMHYQELGIQWEIPTVKIYPAQEEFTVSPRIRFMEGD